MYRSPQSGEPGLGARALAAVGFARACVPVVPVCPPSLPPLRGRGRVRALHGRLGVGLSPFTRVPCGCSLHRCCRPQVRRRGRARRAGAHAARGVSAGVPAQAGGQEDTGGGQRGVCVGGQGGRGEGCRGSGAPPYQQSTRRTSFVVQGARVAMQHHVCLSHCSESQRTALPLTPPCRRTYCHRSWRTSWRMPSTCSRAWR